MHRLRFSGKAETLLSLQGKLQCARLLPQLHFGLKDWQAAGNQWERLGLQSEWLSGTLVVRSSAKTEDQQSYSGAGAFLSVTDVKGRAEIQKAIEQVVDSLPKDNGDHQVLIQPMVQNIRVSGVAFSYEPGQPAPYYVVNYDTDSRTSHQVTQGLGCNLKTLYVARSAQPALSGWKHRLLNLLKELEELFESNTIDVEFVVTANDELILLQVRPLPLAVEKLITARQQQTVLAGLQDHFKSYCLDCDQFNGGDNVLGVMPDWNPAEIIGLRPKPLALSLYQCLITDSVWAEQRKDYGYRDVRGVPLVLDLGGIPFVNVRASFNSLVPCQLPDKFARQLVNFYLQQLKTNPQWHDKVEFQITLASDHFALQEDLDLLLQHGFSKQDCDSLGNVLRDMTRKIIDANSGLWKGERQKIRQLEGLTKSIMSSHVDDKAKLVSLLDVCREFGSRPFAGLARTAFIAMHFLKSLVRLGVFSNVDHERFMQTLSTLGNGMLAAAATSNRSQFLKEFGHMRPGMYDLLAPRYDEMPEDNFCSNTQTQSKIRTKFRINKQQTSQLDELLNQHGYMYSAEGFMAFIKEAIEWRERAKYLFSQSLGEILALCQKLGQQFQLNKDQLVFLEIDQLIELSANGSSLLQIQKAQKRFKLTQSLILPPLITNEKDIDCFELKVQQPNFITLKQVTANTVCLTSSSKTLAESLRGSIVLLINADPGFDWLFTHNIAGLVTLYGGCNSHMAIRAAELGLPAVIGAGEVLFQQCVGAKMLRLDCEQQWVFCLQ